MMDNEYTNNGESFDGENSEKPESFENSEEKISSFDSNEKTDSASSESSTPNNPYSNNTSRYYNGYSPDNNTTYSMRGVGGTAYSSSSQNTYGAASGAQNPQNTSYSPYTRQQPYASSYEGGIRTTYVGGQGYRNSANNGYYQQQNPYSAPENQTKPKKKKSGTAWILVACMVISLVFGAAGAIGYNSLFANSTKSVLKGGATISVASNTTKKGEKTTDGSVAGAADVAKDSVVEITTESVTTSTFFGQYVTSGAGSGVIIDAEKGYIITCAHVVEGATSVTVRLTDGTSHEAKVVGSDTQTDIAVISIDSEKLKLTSAVVGNSDEIVVGETAIAIGNPLGTLGGTVSSGIVSALDREITIDGQKFNLMQIDTSINPGNSGGGLFDIEGNLIGIVNAKSSGDGSSTTIEGLGFAIPINKAIEIATQLTEQGYVSGRVKLGIQYYEVTSSTNTYGLYQNGLGDLMNYITDYGVYFLNYTKGQSGDLMYGDRIVALDGTSISSASDIASLLEEYSVGDTVKLTVSRLNSDMRRSQMVDVDVTLIEYIPETDEAE